jgi:hypothetical protein
MNLTQIIFLALCVSSPFTFIHSAHAAGDGHQTPSCQQSFIHLRDKIREELTPQIRTTIQTMAANMGLNLTDDQFAAVLEATLQEMGDANTYLTPQQKVTLQRNSNNVPEKRPLFNTADQQQGIKTQLNRIIQTRLNEIQADRIPKNKETCFFNPSPETEFTEMINDEMPFTEDDDEKIIKLYTLADQIFEQSKENFDRSQDAGEFYLETVCYWLRLMMISCRTQKVRESQIINQGLIEHFNLETTDNAIDYIFYKVLRNKLKNSPGMETWFKMMFVPNLLAKDYVNIRYFDHIRSMELFFHGDVIAYKFNEQDPHSPDQSVYFYTLTKAWFKITKNIKSISAPYATFYCNQSGVMSHSDAYTIFGCNDLIDEKIKSEPVIKVSLTGDDIDAADYFFSLACKYLNTPLKTFSHLLAHHKVNVAKEENKQLIKKYLKVLSANKNGLTAENTEKFNYLFALFHSQNQQDFIENSLTSNDDVTEEELQQIEAMENQGKLETTTSIIEIESPADSEGTKEESSEENDEEESKSEEEAEDLNALKNEALKDIANDINDPRHEEAATILEARRQGNQPVQTLQFNLRDNNFKIDDDYDYWNLFEDYNRCNIL